MALQLIKFIAKKIQAIFNDELNCTPQVMYEVLTEGKLGHYYINICIGNIPIFVFFITFYILLTSHCFYSKLSNNI